MRMSIFALSFVSLFFAKFLAFIMLRERVLLKSTSASITDTLFRAFFLSLVITKKLSLVRGTLCSINIHKPLTKHH